MTEKLYKCYQCDESEVKFYSKQVGYPICEECYTERYLHLITKGNTMHNMEKTND